MNKNVLVTGGAGYIGSHVCKALSQNGYVPITFDNFSTGHRDFVKWGPLFEGDLLNQTQVEQVFSEYQINSVMHFAAKAYVNESVMNPLKYYRENIQGSMNLLDTFLANNGRYFVFSSSCATYGNIGNSPINEDSIQNPINPYGFTKLAIEKLIIDLEKIHEFKFAILRYFNAAGADANLDLGEIHSIETHVVPLLINAALKGETFRIFGNDYDTPDGTAIRDYVHVSDLAIAHVKSLKRVTEGNLNLICNLGTGKGVSILELSEHMKSFVKDLTVKLETRRAGDPGVLVSSNKLSIELLDISYSNSEISNILRTAYDWHQKLSHESNTAS